MQNKPKTKLAYASLGKGFRKLAHSNSTDIFQGAADATPPPQQDRKQSHIYQSVLRQMQDDQSSYINSLLLSKKSSSNVSHLRAASDFSQAKQAEVYDRYIQKSPPKERYTYNEFFHRESMMSDEFPTHSEIESTSRKKQVSSEEEFGKTVDSTVSFLESIDTAILELSRKGQRAANQRAEKYHSSLKEQNIMLRKRLQESESKLKELEVSIHFKAKKQATREQIHKSKYEEMVQYISELEQSLKYQRSEKINYAKCLKNLQGKIDQIHQTNKQIKVKYDIGKCVRNYDIDNDDDDEQPSQRPGMQRYTINYYHDNKENINRNRLKRNHSMNKQATYM